MPDLPSAEALARALRAHRDVCLDLTAWQAFVLVANLQLALRHPENRTGAAAACAVDIARTVQEKLSDEPVLADVLEAGWDPAQDLVAWPPTGADDT